MSYLGKTQLKSSDIQRFDVTSSTSATHVLGWTAPNEQSLIITINGVKQQDDAYSIAGSPTTVTLTDALVSTDKLEVVGIVDVGTMNVPGVGSVQTDQLADDAVTADKLANSINTEIAANTAKVTNATHTGDVTGATALTIAADAVDIAMLSATGTASASTFLRGDNAWAAAGGGKVNQVVSVFKGDTFSSSSTSMTDVTGLSAAITPSASDSKVLIILSMAIGANSGSQVVARMRRNLDSVDSYPGNGTAVGSRSSGFLMMQLPNAAFMQSTVYTFLDSPASTLEATYNVQVRCETAAQVYVGYTYTDTDNVNFGRAGASITLMEILA